MIRVGLQNSGLVPRATNHADVRATERNRSGEGTICTSLLRGGCAYYLTLPIVVVGVWFGSDYIPQLPHPRARSKNTLSSFASFDGVWYGRISAEGYSYEPGQQSPVAFFPAYPMLGRALSWAIGASPECALLAVSQASLFGVFVLLSGYVQVTRTNINAEIGWATLLAFGLWPTTVFCRMCYTESLFLLLMLMAFFGIAKRWNPLWVALLIGATTGTRVTGVALLPVFVLYLFRCSSTTRGWLLRCVLLGPVACWGLLAYCGFLLYEFGDPLVFMKAQKHWEMRPPLDGFGHILSCLNLQPIWEVFLPSSAAFWEQYETIKNPVFSLQFANPIYFMFAVGLVALGWRKRWLNSYELLLSAGLLLIPYVSHSYRTVMMGQGRYASVVFPAYIVMGHLLARCPPAVVGLLCAISGFMLGAYSALFAAWYRMI